MTGRILRRIECLLRLALDEGAAENERHLALTEALRVTAAARAGVVLPDAAWVVVVALRFVDCTRCDRRIEPAERCYSHQAPRATPLYQHVTCYEEK